MEDKRVNWVTGAVLAILLWVAFYGLVLYPGAGPDADYGLLYDGVFFSMLTLFLYKTYDRFNQTFLTYSLLMFLILFHIGGAFWWYGTSIGVVQFDMIIHAVGGFILAFLMYRVLKAEILPYNGLALVVLAVLGISAVHELLEFLGYSLLGEGVGVFQYGAGDFGEYNDIAWDFISNLLGAVPGAFAANNLFGIDRK